MGGGGGAEKAVKGEWDAREGEWVCRGEVGVGADGNGRGDGGSVGF